MCTFSNHTQVNGAPIIAQGEVPMDDLDACCGTATSTLMAI